MPVLNGLEATRTILKILPLTKVLMLSAHGDDAYVEQATAPVSDKSQQVAANLTSSCACAWRRCWHLFRV
jgi:DNA-binding NarL/FixJ family response regulator